MKWEYDRAEVIADGIVHALGVAFGLAALPILMLQVCHARITAALIYGTGLLTVLCLSAVYNLWPISPTKWVLRRFDHAAIYLLIASTYTPFLTHLADAAAFSLLAGVWVGAGAGIILKLACPARFERLAIPLYLGLGWSGLILPGPAAAGLPSTAVWLLAVGGVLYSAGVIFYLWETLRFHSAVWHAFVLAAAACHFCAVSSLQG
jgi:hemolysin III